jgi:hypothetical protein
METRTPTVGKIMRSVERYFVRWGHPLVVLFPNNYVCVIAGASRMSPTLFFFLNLTGTVGRLLVVAWVGDIFQGPIDSILGWVADYRIPLLAISITIVAVGALNEARRGRKGMRALEVLEREGEDEDAQDTAGSSSGDTPGGAGDADDAGAKNTAEHDGTPTELAPPHEGSDPAT